MTGRGAHMYAFELCLRPVEDGRVEVGIRNTRDILDKHILSSSIGPMA